VSEQSQWIVSAMRARGFADFLRGSFRGNVSIYSWGANEAVGRGWAKHKSRLSCYTGVVKFSDKGPLCAYLGGLWAGL
jgi:hypothetical protein